MGVSAIQNGRVETYIGKRWQEYTRFQEQQERLMNEEIRVLTKRYWRQIDRRLEETQNIEKKGIEDFIVPGRERFVEEFMNRSKQVLINCMEFGARRAIKEAGAEQEKALIQVDWELVLKDIFEALEQWRDIFGEVMRTVENEIRGLLREAIEQGWNVIQIRDGIQEIMRTYYGHERANWRAMRIARTETARAICKGELMAMKRVGVQKKRWITAGDEVTCDQCSVLGRSEAVGINEAFSGGFDGPPAHSNCRCDIIAVIEEEVREEEKERQEDVIDWDGIKTKEELEEVVRKHILEEGGRVDLGGCKTEEVKAEIKALMEQVKIWGVRLNSFTIGDMRDVFGWCTVGGKEIGLSKQIYGKGARRKLEEARRRIVVENFQKIGYKGGTLTHEYFHLLNFLDEVVRPGAGERLRDRAETIATIWQNKIIEAGREQFPGLEDRAIIKKIVGDHGFYGAFEFIADIYRNYAIGWYNENGMEKIQKAMDDIMSEIAVKLGKDPQAVISGIKKHGEAIRREGLIIAEQGKGGINLLG